MALGAILETHVLQAPSERKKPWEFPTRQPDGVYGCHGAMNQQIQMYILTFQNILIKMDENSRGLAVINPNFQKEKSYQK